MRCQSGVLEGENRMRRYKMIAQFVIGDDEDVQEVADKWLKETVQEYEHPSCMFDIIEWITVRTVNDTQRKGMKK